MAERDGDQDMVSTLEGRGTGNDGQVGNPLNEHGGLAGETELRHSRSMLRYKLDSPRRHAIFRIHAVL